MPNWCENNMTIEGSEEAIDGIMKLILDANPDCYINEETGYLMMKWECRGEWRDEVASPPDKFFEALYPEPDGYESKDGWARDKWGTKWDVGDGTYIQRVDGGIYACFQTAWSPPDGVYQHLIENHEVFISAQYEEPGMQFCGEWRGEHDEEGGCCGGYDEYDWNLTSRTELRGEMPDDYHYLGDEVAGNLFYFVNPHGETTFTKVLGLQMGKGIINCFGDLFDDCCDGSNPVEFHDGGFYINDYYLDEVMCWMEENKESCTEWVSEEDK